MSERDNKQKIYWYSDHDELRLELAKAKMKIRRLEDEIKVNFENADGQIKSLARIVGDNYVTIKRLNEQLIAQQESIERLVKQRDSMIQLAFEQSAENEKLKKQLLEIKNS